MKRQDYKAPDFELIRFSLFDVLEASSQSGDVDLEAGDGDDDWNQLEW